MTRKDAQRIITEIAAGKAALARTQHFIEELYGHGYDGNDLWALLRTHVLEQAPQWSDEHRNFKVRLLGKCLQGRLTRLVLGLRPNGPNVAITIMRVPSIKPRRTWRKKP